MRLWTFCLALLLLCVSMVSKAALDPETEADFQTAADFYQTPIEILKAISYLNTRIENRQGISHKHISHAMFNQVVDSHEIEGSPDYFGIMGLSDNQIEQASKQLGYDAQAIKDDDALNIQAAALLLSEIAQSHFANQAISIGDYQSILAEFSGFQPVMAVDFANEVMVIVRQGIVDAETGARLLSATATEKLTPLANNQSHNQSIQPQWLAPLARDSRLDSSVADKYLSSKHFSSRSGSSIKRIVLHTCEGSGPGCANFLTNNSRSVSAHYVVMESGSVTQLVQEKNKAHHVSCCNRDSVGIEHGGFAHKNTWTSAQLQSSFELICDILKRNKLPANSSTVQSHAELDPSRRTDPGPHYPWDKMFTSVKACLAGTPTVKPDLNIQSFSWSPLTPTQGEQVTFTATIRSANANSGANVGAAFFINGQQVGFDATTPMPANSNKVFTIREPWLADKSGQFTAKVLVDDLNKVDESNENNNGFSKTITVEADEPNLPDLTVSALNWTPFNPKVGQPVTFTATIKNQGDSQSDSNLASFFIEQTLIGSQNIKRLGANQSTTVTLAGKWQPLSEGRVKVSARADALAEIAESNEGNNSRTQTLTTGSSPAPQPTPDPEPQPTPDPTPSPSPDPTPAPNPGGFLSQLIQMILDFLKGLLG